MGSLMQLMLLFEFLEQKNAPDAMHQGRTYHNAAVPPWFARFLTKAAFESAITLLRCDVRITSQPMPFGRSAAQLQDHVQRTLPRLFPPTEALCGVSFRLLFSSSSLLDSVLYGKQFICCGKICQRIF